MPGRATAGEHHRGRRIPGSLLARWPVVTESRSPVTLTFQFLSAALSPDAARRPCAQQARRRRAGRLHDALTAAVAGSRRIDFAVCWPPRSGPRSAASCADLPVCGVGLWPVWAAWARLQTVPQRLDAGRHVGLRQRQPQQPVHPVLAAGAQRRHRLRFVPRRVRDHADDEKRCRRGCSAAEISGNCRPVTGSRPIT